MKLMRLYPRIAVLAAMLHDRSEGTRQRLGRRGPSSSTRSTAPISARSSAAWRACAEILFAAGARAGDRAVRRAADAVVGERARQHRRARLSPARSAADRGAPDGHARARPRRRRARPLARRRAASGWPTARLFPTSLGGPPQLSIYAAGHKVAGHLVEALRLRRALARSSWRRSLPTGLHRPARRLHALRAASRRGRRAARRTDAASALRRRARARLPGRARRHRRRCASAAASRSAVRQYRRGTVGKIIFSGGAAHSPDVEADVMGDLAVRRGVPADRRPPRGARAHHLAEHPLLAAILRAHGARDGAGDLDGRSPAARAPHRALLGARRRAHALLRLRPRSAARLRQRAALSAQPPTKTNG